MANQAPNRTFHLLEQVDCVDERGVWLNGEVLQLKSEGILIHYTGYANKFDRLVQNQPDQILKQWGYGKEFQINNRIDVLDTRNK